jgi:hypothetical protein
MEIYEALLDVTCPECRRGVCVVPFPTIEEVKRAAAEGNPNAQKELSGYLRRERHLQRLAELELKSAEELPELEGERLAFEWDFEGGEGERWTVIRCGEREVWREPAVYEGISRFNEVKVLLRERYGARFASLTPTRASHIYLYGDKGGRVETT